MKLSDDKKLRKKIAIHIAFSNLMSKKLRTFLTIIGVTIGVGAVFFLVSVGLGLRELVKEDVVGASSVKTVDVTPIDSDIVQLNSDSVNKFSNLGHVESVGLSYQFASSVELDGASSDAVIFGVDKDYINLSDITISHGEKADLENTGEVMVNSGLLESIGLENPAAATGKTLTVVIPASTNKPVEEDIKEELEIKGVMESGSGSELFVSHRLFSDKGIDTFSQVKLVIDERENISKVRTQLENLSFETSSPIDTIEQIDQFFRFFNFMLIGFGSVGMVVAILGMFNTLTINLLERTREIGLMIALGARRRDIRILFSIEAWIMSILGALVGVMGSIVLALILNRLLNEFAKNRGVSETFSLFSTPLWVILSVLAATSVIGLLVVYFPARRASRISPIDALRHE